MVQNRKKDHIDLAFKSQLSRESKSSSFYYEPMLAVHPLASEKIPTQFLGHQLDYPFWISSMTGGASLAFEINHNLALIAKEFRLGMALGSCRPLLDSNDYFSDFNLRPVLGSDLPFFANLGIAQVEKLILRGELDKIHFLVDKLKATGLIVHINPLQEWFQPEGDRLTLSPLETLGRFLKDKKYPIIVKEVGQGMGPMSLKSLLDLKVEAIELAAFGGTNFSKLEILRNDKYKRTNELNLSSEVLANVGHSPIEMIGYLNQLQDLNSGYKQTEIIISGGIQHALEGYQYQKKLRYNSVIGIAKRFLEHALNRESLNVFIRDEIQTLLMAHHYLVVEGRE